MMHILVFVFGYDVTPLIVSNVSVILHVTRLEYSTAVLNLRIGARGSAGGLERVASRQLPAELLALPADACLITACRRRARTRHRTRAARPARAPPAAVLRPERRAVRGFCIRMN